MKEVFKTSLAMLAVAMAGSIGVPAAYSAETTPPTAYLVSNAHLDTQWNWDIQTTIKEYVWNTLDRNLRLLDKYPHYIFNFEGGIKYAWMKEYYPREYELLKKYISSGRWHLSGASWDATDAIVPSIESAIRNILLGQTFYRDEFGTESTDIFLPDCFGFGWTLPTVASHCGLLGFSSQKLGWRNHPFYGDSKIPYTVGLWQGVDGSRIMMTHGFDYGRRWDDEDLTENELLAERVAQSPLNIAYSYYGTGDIGGSPTITSVKAVDQAVGKSGGINILSVTSDQMYKDFLPYDEHPELPVFDGELTMDVHGTGCYTSQAAMKLYNRQNELLGDAAERAAVAAELLGQARYPSETLTDAWRRFIFHQFHDDLTGTSIPRAYEFSWNDELLSLKQFAGIVETSSAAVAAMLDTRVKGTPVVLYNALGHTVTDVADIKLPAAKRPAKVTVTDENGNALKAQIVGYENGMVDILAEVTVPANGYSVVDVRMIGKGSEPQYTPAGTIENSLYKIDFDANGDISSLFIKAGGKEMVKPGKTIRLAMFEQNESYAWPAWEILKETLDREPVSITGNVKMTLVERGPLRTTLCIEREYGDSRFKQYVRLYEGALADRIDFYNEVDWASTNVLLKAEFPLAVENPLAVYDLGVGTIERGNNTRIAYEVYSQRWADLTDKTGDYGMTVMNDCKYGWDKPDDNTLRLTLLHTPKTATGYQYQNRQDYGHHTFTYSIVPHAGTLDKSVASNNADVLNQRVKAFVTARHAGQLGRSFSIARTDNKNVAIKAFKKAESSDEYVVRIYETSGTGPQTATIDFPLPIVNAVEADGTEKSTAAAGYHGNTLNVSVGKNGIKTYKVTFEKPRMADVPQHAAVPLAYDKRCFSWQGFESDADFSEGYSYAAELIPDTITVAGIPFRLENKNLLNGKVCAGDSIILPAGRFNRLYMLAATASEISPAEGEFKTGSKTTTFTVPSYTGFIGQWGHTDHTVGYLKEDEVAYIGTHRHSPEGDNPYEFTYMFKYAIDIPEGTKELVLPDNPNLVIFAVTLADEHQPALTAASELFRTSITGGCDEKAVMAAQQKKESLVNVSNQISWSGFVNDSEHPRFLHDGDVSTKWCDLSGIPAYVDYDLGEQRKISEWSIVCAGVENPSYITSTCLLQVRNNPADEWKTVDALLANKRNVVRRTLSEPAEARYLRLLVVQPEQSADGGATRIYEFAVY